jgi:GWxTD domain-containing protein
LTELFNLAAVYQRLGRLASPGPIPFVGTVGTLAARGDSTLAELSLSLENRALSFQRDGTSFAAHYQVNVSWQRTGQPPIQSRRDETVRVNSFQETQRADESVLFHEGFVLAPGSYTIQVILRDAGANVFSRVEQAIEIPAYRAGSISTPLLVYQVVPRSQPADTLQAVLNPRGTVANGGDTLLVYLEGYRLPGPTQMPVEVRDDRDSVIYRAGVDFAGGKDLEGRVLRLSPDAPPLGELKIVVGTGTDARKTNALVSFSRDWVVTNYDNLLSLLRYFPYRNDLLNQPRNAQPSERAALWRQFWTATDPVPSTPQNEALDRYFLRIAIANQRFRDEGGEGWRTDRGEVFITLGEPDQIYEPPTTSDRRIMQWIYNEYRASLFFESTLGFARVRLLPESRAEFSRARAQAIQRGLQQQPQQRHLQVGR